MKAKNLNQNIGSNIVEFTPNTQKEQRKKIFMVQHTKHPIQLIKTGRIHKKKRVIRLGMTRCSYIY